MGQLASKVEWKGMALVPNVDLPKLGTNLAAREAMGPCHLLLQRPPGVTQNDLQMVHFTSAHPVQLN